jgi:hypothetical protein
VVGNVGFAFERYGDHFDCLIVVQGLEDELVKLFDVDLRTAVSGGLF